MFSRFHEVDRVAGIEFLRVPLASDPEARLGLSQKAVYCNTSTRG